MCPRVVLTLLNPLRVFCFFSTLRSANIIKIKNSTTIFLRYTLVTISEHLIISEPQISLNTLLYTATPLGSTFKSTGFFLVFLIPMNISPPPLCTLVIEYQQCYQSRMLLLISNGTKIIFIKLEIYWAHSHTSNCIKCVIFSGSHVELVGVMLC